MLVFTKTCARDAGRVAYQALAVARLGWSHVILVERAERAVVEAAFDAVRSKRSPTPGPRIERLLTLEDHMPEAMRIANPYLRQQYCKIVAPTIWGDMFQLDSDMCPVPGSQAKPEWWFDSTPMQHRAQVAHEWAATYKELLGGSAPVYDFMGPAKGWYITADLARMFRLMVATKNQGELHEVLPDLRPRGFKISEYHLLGTFAYEFLRDAYTWIDAPQPEWCHHFTSAEPLTSQQRQLLEEAVR